MNGKSNNIISVSQVQSLEDALKKTLKEEIERLGIDRNLCRVDFNVCRVYGSLKDCSLMVEAWYEKNNRVKTYSISSKGSF